MSRGICSKSCKTPTPLLKWSGHCIGKEEQNGFSQLDKKGIGHYRRRLLSAQYVGSGFVWLWWMESEGQVAPFNSYPDGLRILWDCQAESVSSLLRYGNTSLEMYSQITCRNLGRSNAVYQSSRYLSGSYQHHNFGLRRIGLWFRFLEPFGHNSSPCIGYSKSVACTRWRCRSFEQEQSARHSDDSNTRTDHLSICARVRGTLEHKIKWLTRTGCRYSKWHLLSGCG